MTASQMKKISARVRRRRRLRRLLLAALLLLAGFLLADRNVKPLVFSLAEARSAAMASRVMGLPGPTYAASFSSAFSSAAMSSPATSAR